MISSEPSEGIKQKLQRALKSKAVLAERSKQLQQQVEDFRRREESMSHVATELLERQRELNFMLHRASSVLHQLQDTNLALSAEFTHIVKELPAPDSEKWDDTVNRVNDLFKKTHEIAGDLQEEILRTSQKPDFPRIETREAASAPAPAAEVHAAPTPPVEEHRAPEPEVIHEAEISEEIPHTAEVKAEAPQIEAAPPTQEARIEDLFARVETMQFDERDEDPGDKVAKHGFFARLIGRLNEDA
jgi:hypothetical protein